MRSFLEALWEYTCYLGELLRVYGEFAENHARNDKDRLFFALLPSAILLIIWGLAPTWVTMMVIISLSIPILMLAGIAAVIFWDWLRTS